MPNKAQISSPIIYQTKSGAIELRGDFSHETVWASQAQISKLFEVSQSVISRHINNIFNNVEVDRKSNMQKMHIANSDKLVAFYSLDLILAVGYRANSGIAIAFRQWATKKLRQYIISGFVIDKKKVVKNYDQFLSIVANIKKFLPADSEINSQDVISLISAFADTWLSLEAYDTNTLPAGRLTKKKVELTTEKIINNLFIFKTHLQKQNLAQEIFAVERKSGVLAGIIGNVMQSFGGSDLYESLEEKAAHLLYFIVKNHPFIDGNKRSGAFIFVWFLRQSNLLNEAKLNTSALTALTILVAGSNPKDKNKAIQLILNLI